MFITLSTIQQFHSQESNGVVALALPVRNSIKFNRYALNPTFSFVREQNKYISFTNKKQWAQFTDAPQSYLFSYSGRFTENIGAGVALFQQDFGVLTTFGGMLNLAYNANLSRENNLTFGLNIGAYQSGLNQGRVVVNTPDPSLQNVPSNFLITINPGINYGTDFFDFGVAINNLVSYNLNDSKIIEDNPEQALQAHIMYTGYMDSRGFFDESKFSTLVRSEFKKDQTVISGIAMLNVPKGIWAQAGYNTLYGASAGIGVNVTNNIAVEYNYEQSMGDFSEFGSSHEITLAYRFNKKYRYSYGDDDEERSVFNSNKRKIKRNNLTDEDRARIAERRAEIAARRQAEAEAKKAEADLANTTEKPDTSQNDTAGAIANNKNNPAEKEADDTANKAEIPSELNSEKEANLKKEQEEKLQQEAAKKRVEEQVKLRAQEEARKNLALEKQRVEAEAKAAEEKRLQLEAEQKYKEAQEKAAEEARLQLEVKQKAEAERKSAEAEAIAKAEEEARLQREAEQKVREAQERAAEEARLQKEEQKQIEAEKLKIEAEAEAKALKEARLQLEAEQRDEEERKLGEAETKARFEEERQIAEKEAEAKRIEEANGKAEEVTENNTEEQQIPQADDEAAKNMSVLVNETEEAKKSQEALMKQLSEKIAVKQKDLDDLKKENDLSEQGVYLDPKPFKSLTAENQALETLKDEIDKTLENQNIKIVELETVYLKRKKKIKDKADPINAFYLKTLERLKSEQSQIVTAKRDLVLNLEQIKEATDFERKRRIRRAAYDNQQDRFNKDKAALARIKKFTDESAVPLQEEDFDFGEEQTKNIQIVKNVLNEEPGYYMVIAVHNSAEKRDEFVTKVVASGEKDVNFFFDVKTNKYFIYYEKFDSISQAKNALDQKGSKPYNSKMSLIKIDN